MNWTPRIPNPRLMCFCSTMLCVMISRGIHCPAKKLSKMLRLIPTNSTGCPKSSSDRDQSPLQNITSLLSTGRIFERKTYFLKNREIYPVIFSYAMRRILISLLPCSCTLFLPWFLLRILLFLLSCCLLIIY